MTSRVCCILWGRTGCERLAFMLCRSRDRELAAESFEAVAGSPCSWPNLPKGRVSGEKGPRLTVWHWLRSVLPQRKGALGAAQGCHSCLCTLWPSAFHLSSQSFLLGGFCLLSYKVWCLGSGEDESQRAKGLLPWGVVSIQKWHCFLCSLHFTSHCAEICHVAPSNWIEPRKLPILAFQSLWRSITQEREGMDSFSVANV